MIDIGTRKHGPFDPRYPRRRVRVATPADERSVDRESLDTWEGEGGKVGSRAGASRGSGHRRFQPKVLPSGLSWDRFYVLAYPGLERHYLPAISAWYRYRDADRHGPEHPGEQQLSSSEHQAPVESTPVAGFAVDAAPRAA